VIGISGYGNCQKKFIYQRYINTHAYLWVRNGIVLFYCSLMLVAEDPIPPIRKAHCRKNAFLIASNNK